MGGTSRFFGAELNVDVHPPPARPDVEISIHHPDTDEQTIRGLMEQDGITILAIRAVRQ